MNSSVKTATTKSLSTCGELFLVATPIGNLKDITLRALEILQSAELILCEDTRTSGKLLAHYDIKTPKRSYNDHSNAKERETIITELKQGKNIALVSDAGTPAISDPGYKLVREIIAQNIPVTSIPGACAAIAGITISTASTDHFYFYGFLPGKKQARAAEISRVASLDCSIIFYESPKRLVDTLQALSEIFGDIRRACIAREMTKLHEEKNYGTLAELHAIYAMRESIKGEIVIIVDKPDIKPTTQDEIDALILSALHDNQPIKTLAETIALHTSQSKRAIYNRALELRDAR